MSAPIKYHFEFLTKNTLVPGDADQINKLRKHLTTKTKNPLNDSTLRAKINGGNDMSIMVARLDGSSIIVGMGTVSKVKRLWKNQSEVHDVITHPDHGGKGIGRCVMEHLIRKARVIYNADQIVLTSNAKRQVANHLYKSLGFVQRDTNYFELDF